MKCPWCNEETDEVRVTYKKTATHLIGEKEKSIVKGRPDKYRLGKVKTNERIILGDKIMVKEEDEEMLEIYCPQCGHDDIGRMFYGV